MRDDKFKDNYDKSGYDGPAYTGGLTDQDLTDSGTTSDRDDFYNQVDQENDSAYNRSDYDDLSDVKSDRVDDTDYDGNYTEVYEEPDMASDSYSDRSPETRTEQSDYQASSQANKESNTFLKFLGPILFAIVLLVNYLSGTGTGFPNTQADITARYPDLLSPAGFTFSIWGLIYLGVAASLATRFLYNKDPEFNREYKKIQPLNWAWMVLNIAWIFTFTYDQLGISSFIIVLYTLVLAVQSYMVSSTPALAKHKLMLKWPIGLHFGWLIIATFANITTFLVQMGLNGTGGAGILWTVVAMVLIVLTALYFFKTHENIAIFLPSLWALIGILVKQSPTSNYPEASTIVFSLSVVLFVAGVALAAIAIFQRFQKA